MVIVGKLASDKPKGSSTLVLSMEVPETANPEAATKPPMKKKSSATKKEDSLWKQRLQFFWQHKSKSLAFLLGFSLALGFYVVLTSYLDAAGIIELSKCENDQNDPVKVEQPKMEPQLNQLISPLCSISVEDGVPVIEVFLNNPILQKNRIIEHVVNGVSHVYDNGGLDLKHDPLDEGSYMARFDKARQIYSKLAPNYESPKLSLGQPQEPGSFDLYEYLFENFDAPWLNAEKNLRYNPTLEKEVKECCKHLLYKDTAPAKTSVDKKYYLYNRMIVSKYYEENPKKNNIAVELATHAALYQLDQLLDMAQKWQGQMSVAVLLNGPREYFVFRSFLYYMKSCFPTEYSQITFSIATPQAIPRGVEIQTLDFRFNCSVNKMTLKRTLIGKSGDTINWLNKHWYPTYMMRNLAIENVFSPSTLMLDPDVLPYPKMSSYITKFLKSKPQHHQQPIVVPTYELSRSTPYPESKTALMELVALNLAKPIYKKYFAPSEKATNYPRWESYRDTADVSVIQEVSDYRFYYEPYYVTASKKGVYDENNSAFGFSKSSVIDTSLPMMKGNFSVFTPLYTVRWSDEEFFPEAAQQKAFYNFDPKVNDLGWSLVVPLADEGTESLKAKKAPADVANEEKPPKTKTTFRAQVVNDSPKEKTVTFRTDAANEATEFPNMEMLLAKVANDTMESLKMKTEPIRADVPKGTTESAKKDDIPRPVIKAVEFGFEGQKKKHKPTKLDLTVDLQYNGH